MVIEYKGKALGPDFRKILRHSYDNHKIIVLNVNIIGQTYVTANFGEIL